MGGGANRKRASRDEFERIFGPGPDGRIGVQFEGEVAAFREAVLSFRQGLVELAAVAAAIEAKESP